MQMNFDTSDSCVNTLIVADLICRRVQSKEIVRKGNAVGRFAGFHI